MSGFVRGFGRQSVQTRGTLGPVQDNESSVHMNCVVCEMYSILFAVLYLPSALSAHRRPTDAINTSQMLGDICVLFSFLQ